MTIQVIYYLSDNIIEVDGLINKQTGAYQNSAAVTLTVKDDLGVNISGETWPLVMSYVASSNGKYRTTLKDTLGLVRDRFYFAHIDADAGADLRRHWETVLIVRVGT